MILDGMIAHIKAGSPFLMYPRFIQLFLEKSLKGTPKPQDYIPSVVLPLKVFTFMSHKGVKGSQYTFECLYVGSSTSCKGRGC